MTLRSRSIALVLLSLSLCGCGREDTVDVTVHASGLSAAALASVRTLALQVSGAETGLTSIALDGFAPAGLERFRYRPHVKSGQVTLNIVANDQHGVAVATGQGTATLKPSTSVPLDVTLQAAAPLPLAVTPSPATIGRNSVLELSATRAVRWSVQEAAGGTIDADGRYQAPAYAGLFHVVATDAANPTTSATVVVTVGFNKVVALAGAPGGAGNVDAVGTAARFNLGPFDGGLTSNGAGTRLYLANRSNSIVRRIDVASAQVTTIAGVPGVSGIADSPAMPGGSPATLQQPWGVAVDAAETRLYISDMQANTVRVVDLTQTPPKMTTLCGTPGKSGFVDSPTGTQVQLSSPAGLALDEAHGILYLADYNNNRIRAITVATGATTTLAGDGTRDSVDSNPGPVRFGGPIAVAFDGTALYVSDEGTHVVRTVIPSPLSVTTLAGLSGTPGNNDGVGSAARLSTPNGLASVGDATTGFLVLAENSNNNVTTIAKSNGARTTIAGPVSGGPSGWIDGLGTQARFSAPAGIAVAGGNVYVYDTNNSSVRQIAGPFGATPTVTTWAGSPIQPGVLDGPGAIARLNHSYGAVAVGNDVYVGDFDSNTIRKLAVSGAGGVYSAVVSTVAGTPRQGGSNDGAGSSAQIGSAHHFSYDGAQTLYFTDYANNALRSFDLGSQQVTTLASGITQPHDVLFVGGAGGNPSLLYVTQGLQIVSTLAIGASMTSLLCGGSGQSGFVDGAATAARFRSPGGILTDGMGALYVGDSGNNALRKVSLADGSVTTVANASGQAGYRDGSAADAQLSFPFHMIWTPAQQILIADQSNEVVRVYDPVSQAMGTVLGVSGASGVLLGAAPGGLNGPRGLAILTAGELVVTSQNEDVIVLAY